MDDVQRKTDSEPDLSSDAEPGTEELVGSIYSLDKHQKITWYKLRSTLYNLIKSVNAVNIGTIKKQLLKQNILRGRGLFCRIILRTIYNSINKAHVLASLVAAINLDFPCVGELLLTRCIVKFKKVYQESVYYDQSMKLLTFISYLIYHNVADEILGVELLKIFAKQQNIHSFEMACTVLEICGKKLKEANNKEIYEAKSGVDFMLTIVENDMKSVKLDLVPDDYQHTHFFTLESTLDENVFLNHYKFDPYYQANEIIYELLTTETQGSDSDDEYDTNSDDYDGNEEKAVQDLIQKLSNTNRNTKMKLKKTLLKKMINLIIDLSLDCKEYVHKLLIPGLKMELSFILLDFCCEKNVYNAKYGLIVQEFCQTNKSLAECFEDIFLHSYVTNHCYYMNNLQSITTFFSHLFFSNSISWDIFSKIYLDIEKTSSSNKSFFKFLFQELVKLMGIDKFIIHVQDPSMKEVFYGIFPKDDIKFSIDFFTSIGLIDFINKFIAFSKVQSQSEPDSPVVEAISN